MVRGGASHFSKRSDIFSSQGRLDQLRPLYEFYLQSRLVSRLNLRNIVFGSRVVDYWNGLSDRCINCSTINDFKSKIKVELEPEL